MRFVDKLLSRAALEPAVFNSAYDKAISLYEQKGIKIENSDRIKACAAMAYGRDRTLCDLGSYINAYPVILAILGMKVTTVDYYPQKSLDHAYFNPKIETALSIYRSAGIDVLESDLYEIDLPAGSFDIISSFETFEHLWHSPKPVMQKVVGALRVDGEFVLSVPNIARLGNRVKAVLGKSILPSFPFFYETGYPFTGHRREMTVDEVDWMMKAAGLSRRQMLTVSVMPPLGPKASGLGKAARLLENNFPFLPGKMKSQIFARYTKPA